jgi:hypothetical protein
VQKTANIPFGFDALHISIHGTVSLLEYLGNLSKGPNYLNGGEGGMISPNTLLGQMSGSK